MPEILILYYMHVPIEHHRRVVGILGGTLLALFILLIMSILKVGLFEQKKEFSTIEQYLKGEEVFIIAPKGGAEEAIILPIQKVLFEYIEVVQGCGSYFNGECLNVRSGPGEDYPVVTKLRNNIVLKVGGKVERDGKIWYKIIFDEKIRYPERVQGDWYVSADYLRVLLDAGEHNLVEQVLSAAAKRIVVDRSEQTLYAYDGDELFMKEAISTGIELTPTPRGTFTIFKKTPSRYMQGPIPGITDKYYDLPGVPWNLYFTYQGAVIHGTYWHENFGKPSSNGCVNLRPVDAEKLYNWAELGTRVIVQD